MADAAHNSYERLRPDCRHRRQMVREQHIQKVEHGRFIFGPLLRVIFSRQLDAQLIEGRADHDLEVHRENVLKAVVVV